MAGRVVAVHRPVGLGRQWQNGQQEQTENASECPEFQVRIPRFQIFVSRDDLVSETSRSSFTSFHLLAGFFEDPFRTRWIEHAT